MNVHFHELSLLIQIRMISGPTLDHGSTDQNRLVSDRTEPEKIRTIPDQDRKKFRNPGPTGTMTGPRIPSDKIPSHFTTKKDSIFEVMDYLKSS